jgi:hypothetical protein
MVGLISPAVIDCDRSIKCRWMWCNHYFVCNSWFIYNSENKFRVANLDWNYI